MAGLVVDKGAVLERNAAAVFPPVFSRCSVIGCAAAAGCFMATWSKTVLTNRIAKDAGDSRSTSHAPLS